jgi:hypothetical protein
MLIKTYTNSNSTRVATVSHNEEWNEYAVKLVVNNINITMATSYTKDKTTAMNTALTMVNYNG